MGRDGRKVEGETSVCRGESRVNGVKLSRVEDARRTDRKARTKRSVKKTDAEILTTKQTNRADRVSMYWVAYTIAVVIVVMK